MNTQEARQLVFDSFDDDTYYYYSKSPHGYSNFIDGMAWTGLLCGACYKAGDVELAKKAERYIQRIMDVGKDARNFAPEKVADDWVQSPNIAGYWFDQKPQSFAGPAGLRFAIDNGAHLNDPFQIKGKAKLMAMGGSLMGHALLGIKIPFTSKYIPIPWLSNWLRQHINSMFMAYLILGKSVPKSMLWICEDNPFYSYIAGKKCQTEYPDPETTTNGHSEDSKEIVKLKDRKPSTWVFRTYPYSRYARDGQPVGSQYTPIWQVVADYLQSTL